jgi:hypothetical protein
MNQPEPITSPRDSRDLDKAIFAASWGGFRYVVWEPSWTCYVVTCVPLGRKIVWDAEVT